MKRIALALSIVLAIVVGLPATATEPFTSADATVPANAVSAADSTEFRNEFGLPYDSLWMQFVAASFPVSPTMGCGADPGGGS